MPRQHSKLCPSCSTVFLGSSSAKTCSARCRKRLERARKALIQETSQVVQSAESVVKTIEEDLKPSFATEGGFIGDSSAAVLPNRPVNLGPYSQPTISPLTPTATPSPVAAPVVVPAPIPAPTSVPVAPPVAVQDNTSLEAPPSQIISQPIPVMAAPADPQPQVFGASSIANPSSAVSPSPLGFQSVLSNVPDITAGDTPQEPTLVNPGYTAQTAQTPRFALPNKMPWLYRSVGAFAALVAIVGGLLLINHKTAPSQASTARLTTTNRALTIGAGSQPKQTSLELNVDTSLNQGRKFTATGQVAIQNEANSTNAFSIQNAAGNNILIVDTTNKKVGINTIPTATGADLQVAGNIESGGTLIASGGPTSLSNSGLVIDNVLVCTATGCKQQGLIFNGDASTLQGKGLDYFANASNLTTGRISDSLLGATVALIDGNNTFTGINTFTNSGNSFKGDGSNLTNVNATTLNGQTGGYYTNATNISSGTLGDARLSANVTLQGNAFNGASQLVKLDFSGDLPSLSGINLTNLNASQLAAGTVNDLRLSPNVTLQGNTFNGASQLIQTTNLAFFPGLNGSLITNLNGSAIATGTVSDDRLSANVALLGALSQTFSGNNTFSNIISAPGLETTNSSYTIAVGFAGTATGSINYNFNNSVTPGTYTICTTIGNCAGAGGGVTTPGGTTNHLAKFTGSQALGNSLIYDNGTDVFVNQVSGSYPLDVAGDINSTTGLRVGGNLVCTATGCGVAAGSGNYIQNGTGLQTGANFNIRSASSSSVVGVLEGASGQTADLLDVQSFGGGMKYLSVATTGIGVAGNVNISGVYQVGGVQISSANLSNDSNLAKLNANQTFSGNLLFSGSVTVQPAVDSTNTAVVQNHAGTSNLLVADTTNTRIGIGIQPGYTLDVNGDVNVATGSSYRINGVAICGPSATCAPASGSNNYVQNGVSLQANANFNIQSVNSASIVGILRGASGQTADLLHAQDGTGANVFKVDVTGNVDITGAYKINGISICSASGCTAASGSGSYIQNGTSLQVANMNVQSGSPSNIAAVIGGASGQTADVLDVKDGGTNNVFTVGASGAVLAKTTTNSTAAFQIQTSGGSAVLTADTTNSRVGVNVAYTAMSTPTGLTINGPTAGGSLASSSTYRYKITAIDSAGGETAASTEASGTTSLSNLTLSPSWTAVTGASGYRVYRTAANGASNSEVYLTSVLASSLVDSGVVTPGSATPPASNTAYTSTNNSNSSLQLSIGGNGTPTGQLYVSGTVPAASLSILNMQSGPLGVAVQDHYAYVTNAGNNTMQIVDISNPAVPRVISTKSLAGGTPSAISVQGKYAYISFNNGPLDLQILDISNVSNPTSISTLDTGGSAVALYAKGRYVYLGNTANATMVIIDIGNPAAPSIVSTIADPSPNKIVVVGNYAYSASNSGAFKVFDVSNVSNPVLKSTTNLSSIVDIVVSGPYAYLADNSSNLDIYDITNPSSPSVVQTFAVGTNLKSVALQGRYLYGTTGNGLLKVFDVSNPYKAALVGNVTAGTNPTGVAVQGRYAYLVNNSDNTMQIFDLGGTYTQQLEAGGAEFGSLGVDNNASITGDTSIGGGLQVGASLQASGNLGVGGSSTFSGGIVVSGGINQLSTPAAPAVTPTGTAGSQRWDYTVTAVSASGGETLASAAGTTASGNATLSGTNFNALSWSAVAGASSYKIYRTFVTGATSPTTTGLIGSSPTTTFNDTGITGNSGSSPTINTTGQLSVNGSALFQSSTNSTTAFQIQNSSGTSLLTVDTSGLVITLGAASSTPVILVLGTKNTAGDPTCTNGGVYYNSSSTQIRGCINGTYNNLGGTNTGTTVPTTNLYDGRTFRLRVGSSPYEFVDLVYDATYTKWVSNFQSAATPVLSGSCCSINNESNYTMSVPGYKLFRAAGLTLQIRLQGSAYRSGGTFGGEVYVMARGANVGGTPTQITSYNQQSSFTPGPISISGSSRISATSATEYDSGWINDPNAAGTSYDHLELMTSVNDENTAESCTFIYGGMAYRWVE